MTRTLVTALFFLGVAGTRAPSQSTSPHPLLMHLDTAWEDDVDRTLMVVDSLTASGRDLDSAALILTETIAGRALRRKGVYVDALRRWKRVHTYATHHGDSLQLVEAAKQIGIMNTYMGNYREGQPYLLQVAEIYDAIGSADDRAGALNGLAILNSNLELEDAAIDYYQQALALYESSGNRLGQANIHANLGLLYLERGDYAMSETHLLQQGRLDSLLETNYGLAFHYDFLGYLRQKQGRYEEGLQLALLGLALRDSLPSHYNQAESHLSVAGILLDLQRYDEAIAYAQRVLDFKELHQSLSQESTALKTLSEAYEAKGDAAAALAYYRSYHETSDSMYRRDHLSEIANKNALYEKATQDREIAELGRRQLENETELQRKNAALVITGLGMGVLGFFAVTVWFLFRKISHQKEGLQHLHDQKDLLLREIHHRVKNNLQMVSSLLSLQGDYIEDPAALDAIEMGRQRVRSMSIIHQKLYLTDTITTAVNAKDYLEQLVRELTGTLNVRGLPLELELDLEEIELDIDRLIPLGLIANEVITNSLKHAFAGQRRGKLEVSFRRNGGRYVLRIADDGCGLSPEQIGGADSFGSLLIHTFAEQLDGELSVRGEAGTEVVLEFPG